MKYLKRTILFVFSISILLISCVTEEEPAVVSKLTVSELQIATGYEWFQIRVDEYIPSQAVIQNIKQSFDTTKHKFVIFAKPSCSCEVQQKIFPQSMKVIFEAGISEQYFEIYSMPRITLDQPYSSVYTVMYLPAVVLFEHGIPKYSVIDTINKIKMYYPDSTIIIENQILESLK